MTQPLWTPDSTSIEDAALSAFCTRYQSEHPQLNTRDYAEVRRWSVEQADSFWSALWDFCEVIGEREGPVREGQDMPGTRFFPQAQLNFAEICSNAVMTKPLRCAFLAKMVNAPA